MPIFQGLQRGNRQTQQPEWRQGRWGRAKSIGQEDVALDRVRLYV